MINLISICNFFHVGFVMKFACVSFDWFSCVCVKKVSVE